MLGKKKSLCLANKATMQKGFKSMKGVIVPFLENIVYQKALCIGALRFYAIWWPRKRLTGV